MALTRRAVPISACLWGIILLLGATGCDTVWRKNVASRGLTRADWIETAAPVSDGTRIYVASVRGILMAVDGDTGKVAWKTSVGASMAAAPEVYEGQVFVGAKDGYFRAFDAETGEERWLYEIESNVFAQARAWGDTVYVHSGDRALTALYTDTGELRWQYRHETAKVMSLLGLAQPVYHEGLVYVAFQDGRIGAFDAFSGKLEWAQKYSRSRQFEDIDGAPVIDGDMLYFGVADGDFIAASRASGDIVWRFPVYGCVQRPVLDDDFVYVATQHQSIIALDRRTGNKRWEYIVPEHGVPGAPVIIDQQLIFADHLGRVHFLYTGTGTELDTVRLKTTIHAPLTRAGGHIYAMSGKGYLLKVR